MPDLIKQIHLQNQKIQLLKSRIGLEQKRLSAMHNRHIQIEKAKLLRKWYPKIKDQFYAYPDDLISAILTLSGNGNAQIEIRNINYNVKFYYKCSETGQMKAII